ncbi:MAG: uridine diphosphate-N-acetylglucosamine-binding protein YvcK [Thermoanaerobaculum sp.]
MRASAVHMVALGGGTGLATLLKGAKALPLASLTAVVTVTDDGGSSGRLRQEFGVPAPGDVRNCLVALAEDEELLTRLFAFRFPGEGPTGGHSLGNLFMIALTHLTGDFSQAVRLAGEVLRVRGMVLPTTHANVHLVGESADGRLVVGETAISTSGPPRRVALAPADAPALPEVLAALRQAQLVVLGPGSLFTSIIPNLLVQGVVQALAESRALRVYVANLVTQPGESTGFSLGDHLQALKSYAPSLQLDVVLANSEPLPPEVAARYRAAGAEPVALEGVSGVRMEARKLLKVTPEGTVRHDPQRLAQALWELWEARA